MNEMMMKGGLWKNSEDEVLKAAIMKYGLNRWPTILSLVHKPADQCKARWFEWLHPSITKIAWTREEDEQLLHLAKVMPSQWRTIAPIVGRTPSQCMERYQKLLDAACGVDGRELCLDPNPECRAARPDPVDMDADEKEMLSEVRARLANTRGKKATRKAREKQIEEAGRLVSLQKSREVKAAGIGDGKKKRKRGSGIDYDDEIPFEKRPPPGFYDVTDDSRPTEVVKFPVAAIEGGRADREKRPRKQTEADEAVVRKRCKLHLPAPKIPEAIVRTPQQGKLRRQVLCGLKNLPQPKNDYQIVVQLFSEKDEKFEENVNY